MWVSGLIINVASAGGVFPMPMAPVYATAKAGVVQFTKSVAPVLIKSDIRCVALCPQQVKTPLVRMRHTGLHAPYQQCEIAAQQHELNCCCLLAAGSFLLHAPQIKQAQQGTPRNVQLPLPSGQKPCWQCHAWPCAPACPTLVEPAKPQHTIS